MKFKTLQKSNTGKKFQLIKDKADYCNEEIRKLCKKYNIKTVRIGYNAVYGGISCVFFNNDLEPDKKNWKRQEDGYYPKKNSNKGKEIAKEFESLPIVSKNELNQCIGFNGAPFKTIGYNANNEEYFGFEVDEKWDFTPPDDCKEITVNEWNKLFVYEK